MHGTQLLAEFKTVTQLHYLLAIPFKHYLMLNLFSNQTALINKAGKLEVKILGMNVSVLMTLHCKWEARKRQVMEE